MVVGGCRSHPELLLCTEIGAHSQSTGFQQPGVAKSIGALKNGIRPGEVLSRAILPPLLLHHFPGPPTVRSPHSCTSARARTRAAALAYEVCN